MSYTTLDGLHDIWRGAPADRNLLVGELIDHGYAVIRGRDWDALVQFAELHGLDPDDEEMWARTDDDDVGDARVDALLALANWRKERRDWVASR